LRGMELVSQCLFRSLALARFPDIPGHTVPLRLVTSDRKPGNAVQDQPTTIERAFDLARSGRFATVTLIRKQLRLEGYQEKSQLRGPTLYKQLRALIPVQTSPDIG